MKHLIFRDVTYRVGDRTILKSLTFELSVGETLVFLGRSGSGKTTVLKLINKLLEPDSGEIFIAGKSTREWGSIPLRRQIGYVIQEVGLLPHWTVAQNVGLVPLLNEWPAHLKQSRVNSLLDQVGLPHQTFAMRMPSELSGGQRQRVGVARALAAEPQLLLFDEPFGALDPLTRYEMQEQFLALRARLSTTSVFVTHDLSEALRLGTRIALLHDGHLELSATPEEFMAAQTPTAQAFRQTLPPPRPVN